MYNIYALYNNIFRTLKWVDCNHGSVHEAPFLFTKNHAGAFYTDLLIQLSDSLYLCM